jgi:fibronectin-binding autotransporter adhesin
MALGFRHVPARTGIRLLVVAVAVQATVQNPGGPPAFGQISTTGLLDHFDPNLGVTTDGSGNVTGWTNQAAPGRSVTAGNATTTVVDGPNGSMLRFDAAADAGQLAYASAGSAAYADGYAVFTVVRMNSGTSSWNNFPRLWRNDTNNNVLFIRASNGNAEVIVNDSAGLGRPASSYTNAYTLGNPNADPPTLGQIAIVASRVEPEFRGLYFNGALVSSQTASRSINVTGTTLEIGNSVKGDIGDVLVYDSTATLSDFNQTGITLAQAYQAPWTLTGGEAAITQAITVPLTFAGGTLALGTGGSLTAANSTLSVASGGIRFSGDAGTIGSNVWRLGVGGTNSGVAVIDTSATLEVSADSVVGAGGRGALRQSAGTVSLASGYFGLAGSGGYGHHLLSGGTFSALTTSSGNYVVANSGGGVGVLEIDGGRMDLARFLVGSDGSTSFGQVNVTAGTLDANPGGDRHGTIMVANDGSGRFNLGTLAGGAGMVITGSVPISLVFQDSTASASASGFLNLNSGTIQFNHAGGGIRGSSTGDLAADRSMDLSLNGGTLVANVANVTLVRGGDFAPKRTLLFNGGLTVDTQGFNATLAADILDTTGNGIYRSTSFTATPTGAAGAGYVGPPVVTVSGGSGAGAQVDALVDSAAGAITGFVVTNPGQGYQTGDTLTLTLAGKAGTLAEPYTYTLQASDLAANGTGVITKSGAGTLAFTGSSTFSGGIQIQHGAVSFSTGAGLGAGVVTIGAAATGVDGFSTNGNEPPVLSHTGATATTVASGIALPVLESPRTYLLSNGGGTVLDLAGDVTGGGENVRLIFTSQTTGDNTSTFRFTGANTFRVDELRLWRGAITVGSAGGLGDPRNKLSLGAPGASAAGVPNQADGALRFDVSGTFANPVEILRNNGISTGANDVTLGGVISGNVSSASDGSNLIKLGTGTLTLTASNTYVGATWVRAGTLVAGHASAFGTTGTVNVTADGTLGVADGVALARPLSIAAGGLVRLGNGSSVALPNAAALASIRSESPFEAATNASILYGSGSSVPTVATAWTTNDGSYSSDILTLEGTGAGNLFVLSMSYAAGPQPLSALNILYRETVNDPFSRLGTDFKGFVAWNAEDYLLPGMYGIDTGSQTVWAVTDHNSQFVVAVPEPSAVALLAIGLGGFTVIGRRRRRHAGIREVGR